MLLEVAKKTSIVWPYHRSDSLTHDAMHGGMEHTRVRGRPKRTSLADIAEWTGIGITEYMRERGSLRLAEVEEDSYIAEVP